MTEHPKTQNEDSDPKPAYEAPRLTILNADLTGNGPNSAPQESDPIFGGS